MANKKSVLSNDEFWRLVDEYEDETRLQPEGDPILAADKIIAAYKQKGSTDIDEAIADYDLLFGKHAAKTIRIKIEKELTGGNTMEQSSRFADIRNDYVCETFTELEGDLEAVVSIDAWLTDDVSEEGQVVAQVAKTKSGDIIVLYNDNSVREDKEVTKAIIEAKDMLRNF